MRIGFSVAVVQTFLAALGIAPIVRLSPWRTNVGGPRGGPPEIYENQSLVVIAARTADDLKQKFGGIEGLPTTLLYDRDGILHNKVIGFEYTDIIESELKAFL